MRHLMLVLGHLGLWVSVAACGGLVSLLALLLTGSAVLGLNEDYVSFGILWWWALPAVPVAGSIVLLTYRTYIGAETVVKRTGIFLGCVAFSVAVHWVVVLGLVFL